MPAAFAACTAGTLTRALLLTLSGCWLAACTLTPEPSLPQPIRDLPPAFEGVETEGAYTPLEWWKAFGDPVLDALVESALASNFDVEIAVARVRQARESARIARAGLLPELAAGGASIGQNQPTNAGVGAQIKELVAGDGSDAQLPGFPVPERLDVTTHWASLDFAYEIDFWGRARNDARAAGAEYRAVEASYHAALLGVLAETIAAYFEIVDLSRRLALAHETVDVVQERERLASTRYDRGMVGSLALYRVRQDMHNAQAAIPPLEGRLAEAEGRLGVLLGGYRLDLDSRLADGAPPADPVPAGVPADLLFQRPDVRAAQQRLEAARFEIGARRAALLPALSVSGSIGVGNSELEGLFDASQWFRNLTSNLTAPVFQGRRLRSRVALAHSHFDEMAAAYGRTVVTAVHEVEASLIGLESERRRHALLASHEEEAQASVNLRSQRFAAGVGAYADYLDALRTLLNARFALAGASRDLALARLAVHRALGGAWTASNPSGASG